MGVEAEVFVSSSDRIEFASYGPVTAGGFEASDLKGLGHVELATLGTLLIDGAVPQPEYRRLWQRWLKRTPSGYGETYEGLMDEMAEAAHVFSEEEWIFPIPSRLTRALASLTDENAAEVARRWGQTDDFDPKYFGHPSNAQLWLDELRGLARRAVKVDEELYLWSSL